MELDNVHHEMFCHFVARGNAPHIAYMAIGNPYNKSTANMLASREIIANRIKELEPMYDQLFPRRRMYETESDA